MLGLKARVTLARIIYLSSTPSLIHLRVNVYEGFHATSEYRWSNNIKSDGKYGPLNSLQIYDFLQKKKKKKIFSAQNVLLSSMSSGPWCPPPQNSLLSALQRYIIIFFPWTLSQLFHSLPLLIIFINKVSPPCAFAVPQTLRCKCCPCPQHVLNIAP